MLFLGAILDGVVLGYGELSPSFSVVLNDKYLVAVLGHVSFDMWWAPIAHPSPIGHPRVAGPVAQLVRAHA